MPNAPKKQKGQNRVLTVHWTDGDLDRLSEVTQVDIEKAKAKWRKSVPKKYKKLLDAESVKNANPNN